MSDIVALRTSSIEDEGPMQRLTLVEGHRRQQATCAFGPARME